MGQDDTLDGVVPAGGAAAAERALVSSSVSNIPKAIAQRYEVLTCAGAGGMGVVYKARDRETNEVVALKLLHSEVARDPAFTERFRNELRLARKITHKNVCRIYEFYRADDTAFMTMEYVEGESLRDVLRRYGGVPWRRGLEWVAQICSALAEAHAQGVIHRDLKPDNIMITADRQVKVMDFGIARLLDDAGTTMAGEVAGTPAYMAPEQLSGGKVDARTDIYALGLVLFEMFVGRPAFKGDSGIEVLAKRMQSEVPAPRSIEPDLPERMDRAIRRSVEKDPARRYQSIAELEQALAGGETEVRSDAELQPPQRVLEWRWTDTALLIAALVGLLYFWFARDPVLPASQMRITVDKITAARIVEDVAARLGRPLPQIGSVESQLVFRENAYFSHIWKKYQSILWQLRLDPLHYDSIHRTAELDSRGNLMHLSMPWSPGVVNIPPTEQAREIARQATQSVCGPLPPNYQLKEWPAGTDGIYRVQWARSAFDTAHTVRLVGGAVTEIRCGELTAAPRIRPQIYAAAVAFVAMFILFVLGRCYRSFPLARRLPLLLLLGFCGLWVCGPVADVSNAAVVALVTCGGAAAALIALATAEHYGRRRMPGAFASAVHALNGRLSSPAVALAVLRGTAIGLLILAGETALARTSGRFPYVLQVLVDPVSMGRAIESGWPAAYAVAAALLDSVWVGLIVVGLLLTLVSRPISGKSRLGRVLNVCAIAVVWFFSALHGNLAEFSFTGQGVVGMWACFGLEALILMFVAVHFDLLTLAIAIGTVTLWIINFPLLTVFETIGNASQWAVFGAWLLVVATAAAIAFRAQLAQMRRRLAAWD